MKGQDAMPNFVTDAGVPSLRPPLLVTNASKSLSPPKLLAVRTAVESAKTLRNANFKFDETSIVSKKVQTKQKTNDAKDFVSYFYE